MLLFYARNYMNIWFTKGFNNLFHAIKDIKSELPDCKVLCSHSNPLFLGFNIADYIENEPYFHSKKQFLIYCKEMIKKYNIKLIFPHHKQEWFNEFIDIFKELDVVVATVAPMGGLNTINHKNKFYQKISKIKGINTPQFTVFNSYEEFKSKSTSEQFKHLHLCIKPSLGVYGRDFYDLRKPLSKKKMQYVIAKNKNMLLMEFLDGFEYSADCIAYHGKIIGFVVRKKIAQHLPQIVVDQEDINKQILILTESLQLNGMFNIQFKELLGVPYVLEINPRLAGRSYYATLAGLNIPAIATKLFLHLEKPENISYQIQYGTQILNISTGIVVNRDYSEQHLPTYNEKESQ